MGPARQTHPYATVLHVSSHDTASSLAMLLTDCCPQVMQAQANFVRVRIDRLSGGQGGPPPQPQLLCVVRTLLKKIKQTVLVGDEVEVTGIDWADGRGDLLVVIWTVQWLFVTSA